MWIQQCQSANVQIGTLKSNQSLYTIVGTIKYIVALILMDSYQHILLEILELVIGF